MNELIKKLTKNNTGLTSDDPIIITCPTCDHIIDCLYDYEIDSVPCENCGYILAPTYIDKRWYYYITYANTIPCCRKYLTDGWWGDDVIPYYDLLSHLYNKYKNTEYAPLIMAEILGA